MRGAWARCMGALLLGAASLTHGAYDVGAYTATFELVKYRADVKVTIDITYRIGKEAMDEGFKCVGMTPIEGVRVRDDRGYDLSFRIAAPNETMITWRFPGMTQSTKHVTVKFLAKNMLRGDMNTNYFDAAWAGLFDVPARNAEYRLVFPAGPMPTWWDASPSCTRKGNVIVARQAWIEQPQFRVRFSPGIADTDYGASTYFVDIMKSLRMCMWPVVLLVTLAVFGRTAHYCITHRVWSSDVCEGGGCASSRGCDGCGGCGCWGGWG